MSCDEDFRKAGEMSQGEVGGRSSVDCALSIPQAFVKVASRSASAALSACVVLTLILFACLLFIDSFIKNLFMEQWRYVLE